MNLAESTNLASGEFTILTSHLRWIREFTILTSHLRWIREFTILTSHLRWICELRTE